MDRRKGNWLSRLFGRRSSDKKQAGDAQRESEAEDWLQKGQALELGALGSGQPETDLLEAVSCYDRATELNPRLGRAWVRKSYVLGLVGQFEAAIAACDRALAVDQRSEEAWLQKAMALGMIRRAEESIACSDRALELNPRSDQAWMTKGSAMADAGRFEEALRCFEEAQQLGNTEAESLIAACRRAMPQQPADLSGQPEVALRDRAVEPAAALPTDPQDPEAWFKSGWAFQGAERWEDAIACYDRALELESRGASAWQNKGIALAFLGRFRDALACFEEAHHLGVTEAATGLELCRQKLREQAELSAVAGPRPAVADATTMPAPLPEYGMPNSHRAELADGHAPEIRVFISSTFRDLQAEREHLIKWVFPELRRLCRERGAEFTEIDLRWGVTEEEARQGKVIKICLDEIGRCRPYFIGILGVRYGWTPELEIVARDPELFERYPWVEQSVADKRSVTEIEILHGVLENPAMAEHAFFYFRDLPAAPAGERGPQPEPDAAKLEALKERIRTSGFPVHEQVPDVETLGRLVHDDLLRVIDRRYPVHLGPTPLERERAAHEAFAASRRQAYVEDPAAMRALDEHVAGDGPLLVVVGEAGAGKSALLAHWCARYQLQHPGGFVIAHYVSASSANAGHVGLMRRVIAEIRERYQFTDALPDTPQQIEEQFPSWLARVRAARLVLVLDALDQLPDDAARLAWLPPHLPPQVRLIVSTLAGPTLEVLQRHGWPALAVQPLGMEAREELIGRYLSEYRKALSDEQLQRVSAAPQCANPLFLRTLLEEMRVFGSFEELDARLEYYLAARDPAELFGRLLERMEGDYGADQLRDLATLIWAARWGLAESELLEITGLIRLHLSTVLVALEYHLLRRGGLLTFSHEHLRRAVETRYLAQPAQRTAAHLRLADYFEPQPATWRRATELPWQLERAAAWERLRDCLANLSDSSTTRALLEAHATYELLGYWLALGERYDAVKVYRDSLARYEATGPEPNALLQHLNRLGLFFHRSGWYAPAHDTLRRALALTEQLYGAEDPETAVAAHNLALTAQAQGAYADAVALEHRAIATLERTRGAEHVETSTSLNTLASLLREQGKDGEAEPLFRRALASRERAFGVDDAATMSIANNLATLLGHRGEYVEAEALFRRVAAAWDKSLGPDHPDTARSLANLGHLLQERGQYTEAEPLLRRALAIRERALGSDHPDTAHSVDTLASLLQAQGKYAEAEPLFYRALASRERSLGPEHADTAHSAYSLGLVLGKQGDLAGAEALFRRALSVQETTLGSEHGSTATSLDSLAGVLDDRGDLAGAEPLYRRALAIKERACGPDHPDTAMTLNNLGYLYVKMQNLAAAEPLLRRALAIREHVLGTDHPDTAATLNNLAGVLHEQGDLDGAEALLRHSLAINERLFGPGHPDTARVRFNVGTIRHWRQDYAGAEDLYRCALAVLEPLQPDHLDTAEKLGELASVLGRRGDLAGAEQCLHRALAIQEQVLGVGHSGTLNTLNNLGALLCNAGKLAEAEPLFRRSLMLSERVFGPGHPDTQRVKEFLAAIGQRLR